MSYYLVGMPSKKLPHHLNYSEHPRAIRSSHSQRIDNQRVKVIIIRNRYKYPSTFHQMSIIISGEPSAINATKAESDCIISCPRPRRQKYKDHKIRANCTGNEQNLCLIAFFFRNSLAHYIGAPTQSGYYAIKYEFSFSCLQFAPN